MMFSLQADNIYDVIKPFHFFSMLIGITSFSISKGKKKNFEASINCFSVSCIVLTTIWNLVSGAFFIHLLSTSDSKPIVVSQFYETVSFFMTIVFILITISFNLLTLKERNHFATLLNLMRDVDRELNELNNRVNLKKQKIILLAIIVTVKTLVFFNTIISYGLHRTTGTPFLIDFFVWLIMYVAMESNIFACLHFIFWTWTVKLRFKKLNQILELKSCSAFYDTLTIHKFNKILELHDKLVDASQLICRCYGIPVSKLITNFRI